MSETPNPTPTASLTDLRAALSLLPRGGRGWRVSQQPESAGALNV